MLTQGFRLRLPMQFSGKQVPVGGLLCADDFTRADGALGSTPVGGYAWQGTGGAISSNKLVITPTLGAELLTDPGLEATYTGGLCDSLSKTGVPTLSQSADVHGGAKAQQFTATASNDRLSQGISGQLSVGTWYRPAVWAKRTAGVAGRCRSALNDTTTIVASDYFTDAAYAEYQFTFRAGGTGDNFRPVSDAGGDTPWDTVIVDDMSLKPITFATALAAVQLPYQDVDARVDVTLTARTQAGLWIAGDAANPSNCVLAYHDGTKVYLDQIVAGVYTNKISSAQAYVAGATLRPVKSGDTYTLYYGATEVGSTTITGMTGYYCGTFSTYSGNSLDNWEVYRNG